MEHQTCTYEQPQMDAIVTDGGVTTDDFGISIAASVIEGNPKAVFSSFSPKRITNTELGIPEQIPSSIFSAPSRHFYPPAPSLLSSTLTMGQRAPRPRISIYRNGVIGNIITETGHNGISSPPRQLDTTGGRARNGGIDRGVGGSWHDRPSRSVK